MATILEFRSVARTEPASALAGRGLERVGEIVLFPGVRYERLPEKAEAKPKRGKSRRDSIEIDD